MLEGPVPEALTFDDVLLVPQKSEVVPTEVDIATRLTRAITLRVPIVGAAMDTVTEAPLAIAIAHMRAQLNLPAIGCKFYGIRQQIKQDLLGFPAV